MAENDASPKRITRNRPTKYPDQLVIMASAELYDAVTKEHEATGESKASIARRWMELGRKVEADPLHVA